MYDTSTILRSYLRTLRELCGVSGASLFFPPEQEPHRPGLLLHDGEGSSAPELARLGAAGRFAAEGASRLAALDAGERRAPVRFASADPSCVLVWVPPGGSGAAMPPDVDRRRGEDAPGRFPAHGAWLGLPTAHDG